MPRSTRFYGVLAVFVGATASRAAHADDAADTAAARKLGGEGVTLADSGNCAQAIEKLRRADDLHHAPTTAARLGECEIEVGHLVAGTERLQRLLREPMPPDAPAPFVDAVAGARSALDRARPRIATMKVDVKAPPDSKFRVTVDGEALSDALLGNDRLSDPGQHTIEASGTNLVSSSREITLNDGEAKTVSLELVAAPPSPTPPAIEPHASVGVAPSQRRSSGPSPAAIVALSVGGLGLAAGVIAGVATALDSADLSKNCNSSRQCPSDMHSELTSAKTWATASTVGFAVAGAGLGTGLVLLLVRGHESEPRTEARIHPIVGPLYVGCGGAF